MYAAKYIPMQLLQIQDISQPKTQLFLSRRADLTYGGLKRDGQLGVEVSHGG